MYFDFFFQKPVLQGNIYIIGHVQLRKVKVTDRACADMDQLPYLSLKCRQNSPSLPRDQDYATFKGKTSPYLLFGRNGIYDNSGYVLKLDHSRYLILKIREYIRDFGMGQDSFESFIFNARYSGRKYHMS